jgi:hypothetical protein
VGPEAGVGTGEKRKWFVGWHRVTTATLTYYVINILEAFGIASANQYNTRSGFPSGLKMVIRPKHVAVTE